MFVLTYAFLVASFGSPLKRLAATPPRSWGHLSEPLDEFLSKAYACLARPQDHGVVHHIWAEASLGIYVSCSAGGRRNQKSGMGSFVDPEHSCLYAKAGVLGMSG